MTTETLKEGADINDIANGLLMPPANDGGGDVGKKAPVTQQVDDDEDLLPGDDGDAGGDDVWNSEDEQSEDNNAGGTDEGGDETDEGQEGKDNNEPFYTVQVNGKSQRVPLSEALKGYQRNADYTQKTQEIATLRKNVEAEHTAAQAARQQYDQQLAVLTDALGEEKNDPKAEDWERLKVENPDQYAVQYADYQRRLDARGKVKQERERVAQAQQTEVNKIIGELAGQERNKLLEHFPTWKEPEKYKAGAKAIFDFGKKQYGFTDQELNTTLDHRIIRMADDARKYRALVSKQAAAKSKLDNAPTVEPRGRTPQPSRKQTVRTEARTRLIKTGKIDDAVSLIMMK